jgi:hypothetical protein
MAILRQEDHPFLYAALSVGDRVAVSVMEDPAGEDGLRIVTRAFKAGTVHGNPRQRVAVSVRAMSEGARLAAERALLELARPSLEIPLRDHEYADKLQHRLNRRSIKEWCGEKQLFVQFSHKFKARQEQRISLWGDVTETLVEELDEFLSELPNVATIAVPFRGGMPTQAFYESGLQVLDRLPKEQWYLGWEQYAGTLHLWIECVSDLLDDPWLHVMESLSILGPEPAFLVLGPAERRLEAVVDDEDATCPLSSIPLAELVAVEALACECGARFDRSHLQQHWLSTPADEPLACPSCATPACIADLQRLLTHSQLAFRAREAVSLALERASSSLSLVPCAKGCGGFARSGVEAAAAAAAAIPVLECCLCHTQWCSRCGDAAHPGVRCGLGEPLTQLERQDCPGCGKVAARHGWSNSTTCDDCSACFCFVCGFPWGKGATPSEVARHCWAEDCRWTRWRFEESVAGWRAAATEHVAEPIVPWIE